MNNFDFLKSENLDYFLSQFRKNTFNIHCKLLSLPKVNKRYSTLTIIAYLIPWRFINLLIKFSNNSIKRRMNIGIINHNFLKPYNYLLDIKNNCIIDKFTYRTLQLIAYKILTSFKLNKSYENSLRELVSFFNKFNFILIPHDTHPETFLLTQLFKYSNETYTVCIQHGTAARIYRSQDSLASVIWDGMNSDVFLAWNNDSAKYMKDLLKKSNYIIRKNNIKFIILNCCRNFHYEKIFKNYIKSDFTKEENIKNLSIYFLQVYTPDSRESIIYDNAYKKLFEFLQKHYSSDFKKISFFYKVRTTKSIPKFINKDINIKPIILKESIYKDLNPKIFITGETTLAFEMRESGFEIIGLALDKKDMNGFPESIYNRVFSIDMISENNLDFLKDLLPNKEDFYLRKFNPTLTCYSNKDKCISAIDLNNKILNMNDNK